MHGLINRSLQGFVQDCYGPDTWGKIVTEALLPLREFESMLSYPDEMTEAVISTSCAVMRKDRDEFLGDLGTYLVSHPNTESLRRLLRFGGTNFVEFLQSLDDIHERVRLAIPNLLVPPLTLYQLSDEEYSLRVAAGLPGFGPMLAGLLRAMGDDYGALVIPDCVEIEDGGAVIHISVVEMSFAEGKQFDLAVNGA